MLYGNVLSACVCALYSHQSAPQLLSVAMVHSTCMPTCLAADLAVPAGTHHQRLLCVLPAFGCAQWALASAVSPVRMAELCSLQ